MIAEVARILAGIGDADGPPIGFIEAGTGTGKTGLSGWCLPCNGAGNAVGTSTATVSLQSQLIEKDIPELIESTALWSASRWPKVDVAICARSAWRRPLRLLPKARWLPDELSLVLESDDRDVVSDLSKAWAQGEWGVIWIRSSGYLGPC